jgi:hypothetical protein
VTARATRRASLRRFPAVVNAMARTVASAVVALAQLRGSPGVMPGIGASAFPAPTWRMAGCRRVILAVLQLIHD